MTTLIIKKKKDKQRTVMIFNDTFFADERRPYQYDEFDDLLLINYFNYVLKLMLNDTYCRNKK